MNLDAISFLLSASIVFVGTHILLAHPLRRMLTGWLGARGFVIGYSLIALITFSWMIHAFVMSPASPMLWDGWHVANWVVASGLTILALVFFLGSVLRNPALPHPEAQAIAQAREATGIFAVTRHPMMWSFALWAAAHIIVAPNPRTIVFAGSLAFLALVGAALQDRKKTQAMGPSWIAWQARTTYWPQFGKLGAADAKLWLAAVLLWLFITWVHMPIAGQPAGAWRWIG